MVSAGAGRGDERRAAELNDLTQHIRRCKGRLAAINTDLAELHRTRRAAHGTSTSLRACLRQQLEGIVVDQRCNEQLRQRLRQWTAETAAEAGRLRKVLATEFLIVGSGTAVRFAKRLGAKNVRKQLHRKHGDRKHGMLSEFQRLEAKQTELLERQDVAGQMADELIARHAAVKAQLAAVDTELPRLRPGLRQERAAVRREWAAVQARANPIRQAQLADLRATKDALRREIADSFF